VLLPAAIRPRFADEFHHHPWLLQIDATGPWIAPNGSDRDEWQPAVTEGAGFTELEIDQVLTLLSGFAASSGPSLDRRSANGRAFEDLGCRMVTDQRARAGTRDAGRHPIPAQVWGRRPARSTTP
jgi:hypothetical protein